jgi:Mg/Co/Ni transporter MgtE
MEITNYINTDFKPFNAQDAIGEVQDFFLENNFTHFPVLDNQVYIGSISAEDAETLDANLKLQDYKYVLEPFFTRITSSWIEILEGLAKFHSNVIPVLGANNEYSGYYEAEEVIKFFYQTPFFRESGQIFKIRKNIHDFSISQIAQIVESNNAKVVGLFISEIEGNDVEITIKTNQVALNEIIQTFRRYNYEVTSTHEDDNYINILKERSEYLSKYLDI